MTLSEQKQDEAAQVLMHYLKEAGVRAGVDTQAEVHNIISLTVDAAVLRIREEAAQSGAIGTI